MNIYKQIISEIEDEITLARNLKKELKRLEQELKNCQERMVEYNRKLNIHKNLDSK